MGSLTLEEYLVCPVCHGELRMEVGEVSCLSCARTFPCEHGIIDFTPNPPPDDDVAQKWSLWEQLQDNAVVAYDLDPDHNLSVGDRMDAIAFRDFCSLEGMILDVGCGPQETPSYGAADLDHLIGIDPLLGVQPRMFKFFLGIGEYLPFRSTTFDCVLFATSLDHMLSPVRALTEAARVLTNSGTINCWFHEHLSGWTLQKRRLRTAGSMMRQGQIGELIRRTISMRYGQVNSTTSSGEETQLDLTYLAELEVPEGAADYFHFDHPTQSKVMDWLIQANLKLVEHETYKDNHRFFKAKRRDDVQLG